MFIVFGCYGLKGSVCLIGGRCMLEEGGMCYSK